MAQASGIDELAARRRALAAERQRRRRAKLATDGATFQNAAPEHGERARIQPEAAPTRPDRPVSAPHVHGTERLDSIGAAPADFTGVPPEASTPAELVAAPDPSAALGAQQFAKLLGFMVRLSLEDVVARYGVAGLADVPAVGAIAGANPAALVDASVEFVKERAERCALKYGFGLRIPYEDEVVTIGAAAGSGVYLLRKFTGRLPEPGNPPKPRTEATGGPPSRDGADADDHAFGKVNVDVEPGEPLPSWMAGG